MDLLDRTRRLAEVEYPVIVYGERGTGKELLAERLHFQSARWEGPLVKVNCAALPESLMESELFGHEAGAFTGAVKRHEGRFARADGGTIFLDEIHTASLALQEKLLRIVEYGEYERVGGNNTLQTDVRIVAATNENLRTLADHGKFRADLLDRICFDLLVVPALRERLEDVLVLAEHFAIKMSQKLSWSVFPGFTKGAEKKLLEYHWPGNIRELKTTIERTLFHHVDEVQPIGKIRFDPFLRLQDIARRIDSAEETPGVAEALNFNDRVKKFEIGIIQKALRQAEFNQTICSKNLGLSYHQLRNLLKKYKAEILIQKFH